jgi:predicted acetylornithine/succinylornithine family transaminase
MNLQEIEMEYGAYVMPTYSPDLALVRGEGTVVWDATGNAYLDFSGGLAVASVGHCHPRLVAAIHRQASTLIHVSNLYYNELQPRLAKAISARSLGGKCFFCNSGAEANEGLIKLARRWGHDRGRFEVITFESSFHGRTLATLTATGQAKVKQGFDPLPPGFVTVPLGDLEAIERALTPRTAAVLIEPILGEGGIHPMVPDFLQALRGWCDRHGLLLLCDEVQSGFGRTGRWFAYQHASIRPDAISMAKGMGGGVPIGGVAATPEMSQVLGAGSHATTFGGNPLGCAAALAVIDIIESEGLLDNAVRQGDRLRRGLDALVGHYGWITEARGIGLMAGLELSVPAGPVAHLAREKGLLVIPTARTVLRLVPPLTVSEEEVDRAIAILRETCAEADSSAEPESEGVVRL